MPQLDSQGVRTPPIQEDETALIPYAVWEHYLKFRDIELIKPWFRPLVIHTSNFMENFRDERTGLPMPSFDLWEEKTGIYSFTVASVYGGLTAAANFADLFGEIEEAKHYRQAAAEIKVACEKYLYDPEEKRFLKSIVVKPDGSIMRDMTIDASIYGLWYFGMFEPADPRIERTMSAIADGLWCDTNVGGLARYEGDEYHWDAEMDDWRDRMPGNPWIVTTMWLAQYKIAMARNVEELREAVQYFEWACERALPSGVLAEQYHPMNGAPLSVSPLTWSHAAYVAAVKEYVDKYAALTQPAPSS
jgi:GH15 family glucan-1,4-alpha-glucosidase